MYQTGCMSATTPPHPARRVKQLPLPTSPPPLQIEILLELLGPPFCCDHKPNGRDPVRAYLRATRGRWVSSGSHADPSRSTDAPA